MSKADKRKIVVSKKARQYTPVIVYFGVLGVAFLSYVVARIALAAYPHPVHWASAVAGAIAGYFLGWAWYRWRGDII